MDRIQVRSLLNNNLYNSNRKYKVNDVVVHNSIVYQNVTGKQGEPGTNNDWIQIKINLDDVVTRYGTQDIPGLKVFSAKCEFENGLKLGTGGDSEIGYNEFGAFFIREVGQDRMIVGQNFVILGDYTNNKAVNLMFEDVTSLIDVKFKNESGTISFDKQNFVFVDKISDLPNAVSNVRTLANNTAYYFTKSVDLAGSRLVGGQNTVILGSSSESVILSSTGLTGTALITSNYSLPIRNISISANVALNLDGDGSTTALDWFGVNFLNCATVGTIKDYTNHVWTDCAFIESGNLTYDGSIGSIAINSSLFNTASGQTAFIIASTCIITRRLRFNLCAFIIGTGETGINLSTSTTIPNESYILSTCNFSGGGTYTTGVLYNDNKSRFRDNVGIPNSNEISQYYMNGNATATVISVIATPVKVLGTTNTSTVTQRFTNTNNRATYNGSVTRVFEVMATLSLTSGNNNQIGVYVSKNGVIIPDSEMYVTTSGAGRAENVSIQTLVSLSTNDYIEIFVENNTSATNITVSDLNTIIK